MTVQANGHSEFSTAYLDAMLRKGNRWALTSLAMLYLKGKGVPKDTRKGRMLLFIAVASYDRVAACRLALYFQFGQYGFEKDLERAAVMREKATRWLTSDAALIYDDPELARRAQGRYRRWAAMCDKVWNIDITQTTNDLDGRS
jgi:TPR repeat protein